MKIVDRFVALLECPTEEEWLASILQLGTEFGFEQTQIVIFSHPPSSFGDAFIRGNFSARWLDYYDSNQLVYIDPTVSHCISRSTPLIWTPAIFTTKQQKMMHKEATRFGLRSGITLPFHGVNGEVGMLSFAKDSQPSTHLCFDLLHIAPDLSMLRDFAFEASRRFTKPHKQPSPPSLTQREHECLTWCASGKSSWEIAKILGCSESTVNFHFDNLRRKFHTTSRRQVVVKAINLGIIHRPPQTILNYPSFELAEV